MKDTRDKLWSLLERDIQKRASLKDSKFILKGKWKKFSAKQEGFKIYSVNGTYIRNNICTYFGHGGHGLVHEFIPLNEIWISTHHYHEGNTKNSKCSCKVREKNQPVSKKYFKSCVLHEIFEFKKMKQGMHYWDAHILALDEERKAGIIKDPFIDM